jgi:phosphate transport system substrate-binding protein
MSTTARLTNRIFICLLCFSHILSCLLMAQPVTPKRLYVAPFTTTSESDKLRTDLLSQLRKDGAISLVSSEAEADVILDGGGEIWVKGYRSLNPRSGRMPSNGTPVYDGYLSVELRGKQGQTFWSYLVTPGMNAVDVSKDLAKRIARHVVEAIDALDKGEKGGTHAAVTQPAQPAATLRGAGATFPEPVYEKWFTNYRRQNPNLQITYAAVGSEAGVRRLLEGSVDFGASDNPQAIHEIAPDQDRRYLFFPSVVGAVVPVVNLPGVPGDIALTSEALAGIYLGRIKKWNDPVLQRSNRGRRLPDLDIVVVHRSDGSGTSYAWTDYLSKTSPEWKAQIGASLNPKWPVGKAAEGNDGVAKLVKELGGSIGYVEFIYALKNHMSFAKVQNHNGEFVAASLESMALAANDAVAMPGDFKLSIVDAPGAGAYPIATFTWLIIPAPMLDPQKRSAMQGFLEWMLREGQLQASALGYLALPRPLVLREQAALKTAFY